MKKKLYDVVALSEYVRQFWKTVYDYDYDAKYRIFWSDVLKASYFTNRRKIDIDVFEEIVKNHLNNDSDKLLSYLEDNKSHFNF